MCGFERQVCQEQPEIEGRIAEMARFEVNHHQATVVDQQILGREVGMHQRAGMIRDAFDKRFQTRRRRRMHFDERAVVRIDAQFVE